MKEGWWTWDGRESLYPRSDVEVPETDLVVVGGAGDPELVEVNAVDVL